MKTTKPSEFVVQRNGVVRQAGASRDATADLRVACEASLYIFCKAITGFSKFVPHLHLPLCRWFQQPLPRKKILLMPRSTFKTSMVRGLGMWITIQQPYNNPYFPGRDGRDLRILYAAENEKRAISRITWIRRQYEHNALFRTLWPGHVWEAGEKDASIWTLSRFALPRHEDYPEATFEGAGVDSGSTGGHYDITVKDDLIGERCLKQPELINSAISWWQTSHSLFDDENIDYDFVLGTRWKTEDIYSWIFENETDYDARIYSAINRPLDLPPSGNPDKLLLFPERLDRALLAELKRKYGQLYYLNYENEPFSGGNAAFTMALCGSCTIDSDFNIAFDAESVEQRMMAIVEADAPWRAPIDRTVKPFYRLTPADRVERFTEMAKQWHRDKINRIESN